MKRKIIMGILMLGILCFAACGKESSSDSAVQAEVQDEEQGEVQDAQEEVKESKKEEKKKVDISLEGLRNHEVAPESDFEVSEYYAGVMIDKYIGNDELVVIPDEIGGMKVLALGSWVFEGANVKGVKLSDSVETLTMTFMDDTNIKYVICGSGLKTVETGTFAECASLETIEFQEGLTTIGQAAITGCKSMKALYIPESVTEMEIMLSVVAMPEGFTVQGKTGSIAEELANQKGYIFEAID